MACSTNLSADWCRRDTREKVLALPRGLSAPPQLIPGAQDSTWEYPILPRRIGPHTMPGVMGQPRLIAPNSLERDFHTLAQPGNGAVLSKNLDHGILINPFNPLINPFNPLSGLCDGPRMPEMDAQCCALCSVRITGYMSFLKCANNSAFCYFCYLEHAKHMTRWQTSGRAIPNDMLRIAATHHQAAVVMRVPHAPPQQEESTAAFDPDTMFV